MTNAQMKLDNDEKKKTFFLVSASGSSELVSQQKLFRHINSLSTDCPEIHHFILHHKQFILSNNTRVTTERRFPTPPAGNIHSTSKPVVTVSFSLRMFF